MIETMQEFYGWEKTSRDTIDFKKIYCDIAEDVRAGLVLSELIYWYLPSKNGDTKLRVKRDGHYWIAVRRYEWWERTRMSPRQADRDIDKLIKVGVIEKRKFKFSGKPTVHIRIIEDTFLALFNHLVKTPKTNPFLPNGNLIELTDSLIAVTENTLTETTTDSLAPNASGKSASDLDSGHSKHCNCNACQRKRNRDVAEHVMYPNVGFDVGFDSDLLTLEAYYYQGVKYAGYHCPMCDDVLSCDVWFLPLLGKAICEHCFGRLEDAETIGRNSIELNDSGHDDEQPILMAAVVATLNNIIAHDSNEEYTLRHNPRTWAECERLELIVDGRVTDKGFELIAQHEIGHEGIALEIRAANDATRGIRDDCPDCGNKMRHDGIEFVCDECCGKASATVDCADVLTCNVRSSVWCRACPLNNNAKEHTSLAGDHLPSCPCDECQATVADLAARPALPVAENDDRFLGTRDAPVTPNGADWTRDAVDNGNADDDIPDSSLCGYREPDGYMACHDCMGYGVCDSHAGARQVQGEPHTPPETPATSTGAIVPALEAQQDTIVAKPVKPLKTGNGKKPGKSPEQKQIEANMWEAVKFVWRLTDNAAWKITKFRKFFLGTVKNSKADKRYGEDWKNCQLDEYPATPQEVVAFGHWYRNTYDDITLPEKGQTLLNHFEGFRGHESYNAFIRKAANTILEKLPKFSSPGIELEREQNKPVDEAEIMVLTQEQKDEIQSLMSSIGKGGN